MGDGGKELSVGGFDDGDRADRDLGAVTSDPQALGARIDQIWGADDERLAFGVPGRSS